MKSRNSILVTVGFLMLLVVGWTIYGQQSNSTRPAWEYMSTGGLTDEQMNALGAEGWELVNFERSDTLGTQYIFKRHKNR